MQILRYVSFFLSIFFLALKAELYALESENFAHLILKPENSGEGLIISGNECNSGIFFRTPEKFSCFCLTGIWAFYSSWCTVPVSIFAGINHCQKLNETELTQVSLLSSNSDPYSQTLARVTPNMYQLRDIVYQDSKVNWSTTDSSFLTSGAGVHAWTIEITDGEPLCLIQNATIPKDEDSVLSYCVFDIIGDYAINYVKPGCNSSLETIEPVYCKEFLIGKLEDRSICFNNTLNPKLIDTAMTGNSTLEDLQRLKRASMQAFSNSKYDDEVKKANILVRSADVEQAVKEEEAELKLNLDQFKEDIKQDSQRAKDLAELASVESPSPSENLGIEEKLALPEYELENSNSNVPESIGTENPEAGGIEQSTDMTEGFNTPDTNPYTGQPGPGDSARQRAGKTDMPLDYYSPDSNPYTGEPGFKSGDLAKNLWGKTDLPLEFYSPDSNPYTGDSDSNQHSGDPAKRKTFQTATEPYLDLVFNGEDFNSRSGYGSRGGPIEEEEEECLYNIHAVKNNPLILSHLGSHVELKIGTIVGTRSKIDDRKKWPAVRILTQILEIMKKTCKSVSAEYLDMAIDTFINLQIHSFHLKEPFISHPTYFRIERALEKCYKIAVPHAFVTNEVSRKPIGTTCENGLKPSSNKIVHNGKVTGIDIPEDRKAKGFEPVIETAWKVLVNAHSYCYKHFSDFFNDHHAFTVALMPFFNNEVQRIWMPPRLNGTYVEPEKNEQLYGGLIGDHTLILNDIDNCVGASRIGSAYPWHMSRPPKDETNRWRKRKRRSIEELQIPTNQFCLNSPDDPINLFSLQRCER